MRRLPVSKLKPLVLMLLGLLLVITSTAGCGGGGGGGVSVPNVPTVAVPSLNSTSTSVATLPSGPTVVNSGTQQALDPAQPPITPSTPPPSLALPTVTAVRGANTVATLPLTAGWNIVSFPFAKLQSASGFTHEVYAYTLGTFTAYDPVNNPSSIDTRLAYLAYADQDTQVVVGGIPNTGQLTTTTLTQGWNLIGCPASNSLPWSNMTATRAGVTRALEEVATASQTPDSSWLLRYAFGTADGVPVGEDILTQGDAMLYGQGRWLFVWQGMDLNLNVAPPQPAPSIASLSASSFNAGDSLTISGTGFATSDAGTITIGGQLVPVSDITSWSNSQIVLTVPVGALSGNLIVFINRFPSNRVAVTVGNTGGTTASTTTATITGLCEDTSGNVLPGTQVMVDSGQYAVSDANGNYTIGDIPPGDHLVIATHIGNNVGTGQFTLSAGVTTRVLVQLAPLSQTGSGSGGSPGGTQSGTLDVVAYPYDVGSVRWFVHEIQISEYGNYSNRWTQYWDDLGQSSFDLTADSAVVGRDYVVHVTWEDTNDASQQQTGTWYVTLYNSSETKYYYGP